MKSQSFEGTVIFGFDAEGLLKFYENDSEMNQKQSAWLLDNFPFSLQHLKEVQGKIKGKLEEIPADLSFDAFWNKYRKKVNRKRSEPLWRKMSDSERMLCLMSINSYDNYLKRTGRAKLDPENYLKKYSWETNWNQITS
jgi:hypothetical protein